jgi:hypothetical protein
MVPSFVMCPIRNTGMPVIFEYLRSWAAHSLTWETDPAEDSRIPVLIV